jgi:hypothetical protein
VRTSLMLALLCFQNLRAGQALIGAPTWIAG